MSEKWRWCAAFLGVFIATIAFSILVGRMKSAVRQEQRAAVRLSLPAPATPDDVAFQGLVKHLFTACPYHAIFPDISRALPQRYPDLLRDKAKWHFSRASLPGFPTCVAYDWKTKDILPGVFPAFRIAEGRVVVEKSSKRAYVIHHSRIWPPWFMPLDKNWMSKEGIRRWNQDIAEFTQLIRDMSAALADQAALKRSLASFVKLGVGGLNERVLVLESWRDIPWERKASLCVDTGERGEAKAPYTLRRSVQPIKANQTKKGLQLDFYVWKEYYGTIVRLKVFVKPNQSMQVKEAATIATAVGDFKYWMPRQ